MNKLKKSFVFTLASLMCLTAFSGSVSASKEDVIKEGTGTLPQLEEIVTDGDVNANATVIMLPGPIKYKGTILNHQLPELIASKDRYTTALNWIALGMGGFWSAPAAGAGMTASAAGLLAGVTTKAYTDAYNKGQNVYYGASYSTPEPGLSIVPFIFYSKTPYIYDY